LERTGSILTDECVIDPNRKLNSDGYLRVNLKGKVVLLYKHQWEQENGPVPEGMELHHRCRNRACFNTNHLELIDGSEHIAMTNRERLKERLDLYFQGKLIPPYRTLARWRARGYISNEEYFLSRHQGARSTEKT
jgi:hypothetical protein